MSLQPDIGGSLRPTQYNYAQLAALAHIGGWSTRDEIATAVAIASAETGGTQRRSEKANKNGTYDWGVWQINDVHKPSDAVKNDARENAKAAYKVYTEAGHKFTPWATYNSGSYKKYLDNGYKGYDEAKKNGDIEGNLKSGNTRTDAGASGTNDGFGDIGSAIQNALSGAVSSVTGWLGETMKVALICLAIVVIFYIGMMLVLNKPLMGIAQKGLDLVPGKKVITG